MNLMFNDRLLNTIGIMVVTLQLILVGLRLHNDIMWSWWLVFLPVIITLFVLMVFMGIVFLIMKGMDR